jgi:hypothetical protein
MGKLQAHEKRVNDIQEDVSAQTLFLKHYSKEKKMVLDISKEVESVDKTEKNKEETNLKEETPYY